MYHLRRSIVYVKFWQEDEPSKTIPMFSFCVFLNFIGLCSVLVLLSPLHPYRSSHFILTWRLTHPWRLAHMTLFGYSCTGILPRSSHPHFWTSTDFWHVPLWAVAVSEGLSLLPAKSQIPWGQRICCIQLWPLLCLVWTWHREGPSSHCLVSPQAF